MAKTRDCDRCHQGFSERLADWGEFSGTVHGRYDDGSPHDRTERVDFCPPCTKIMFGIPDPPPPPVERVAIPVGKRQYLVDKEEHDAYVEWLENQTGVG